MTLRESNTNLSSPEGRAPHARRMRELREAAKKSQSECAEALGVTQPVYSEMEANTVAFRRRDLVTLAHLYKMPLTKAFPGVK